MIRNGGRREKPGEFEPAVPVRRAHHGNLDALIAQSSDTSGPFSFDRGLPFELEAELAKEINRRCEVIDDDSYVVHPFKRHVFRGQVSLPLVLTDLARQDAAAPDRRAAVSSRLGPYSPGAQPPANRHMSVSWPRWWMACATIPSHRRLRTVLGPPKNGRVRSRSAGASLRIRADASR